MSGQVTVIDGITATATGGATWGLHADRVGCARAQLAYNALAAHDLDPAGVATGERVTIVRCADHLLGGVSLLAHDARWLALQEPGWQTKGQRGRYHPWRPDQLVLPGWQATSLHAHPAVSAVPDLGQLCEEDLRALPSYEQLLARAGADALEDPPAPIGLAAYGVWPVMGEPIVGAAWLLYAYNPDTDIAEGYLAIPDGQPGYCEHGSVYGADLLHRGDLGTLPVPTGLSFTHCMHLEHAILDVLLGHAAVPADAGQPGLDEPAIDDPLSAPDPLASAPTPSDGLWR